MPSQWPERSDNHQNFPFLQPAFLAALEKCQCVGQRPQTQSGENSHTGWQPNHIVSRCGSVLIPSYIKTNSYGEYVFDWAWADAYNRYGFEYFPKLLSATPFTPVPGPRWLGSHLQEQDFESLAQFIGNQCEQQKLSSWHFNFIDQVSANALADSGLSIRHHVQFEWFNQDYQHFDDFLQRFASRKRKNVKKERAKAHNQVDQIRCLKGSEIGQAELEAFYLCYQTTYLKRGQMGYLSAGFFQTLVEQMPEQIMLAAAWQGKEMIAAALFFYDDNNLYGRYWGCLAEHDSLHFELCYYQGIEFCIDNQLTRFNPGTQGEHKIARGFEPQLSYSAHYIREHGFRDAIDKFCQQEQKQMAIYAEQCKSALPYKQSE